MPIYPNISIVLLLHHISLMICTKSSYKIIISLRIDMELWISIYLNYRFHYNFGYFDPDSNINWLMVYFDTKLLDL